MDIRGKAVRVGNGPIDRGHPVVSNIDMRYDNGVIRKIIGKTTQDIYDGVNSKHARSLPKELHPKARRLLDQINTAPFLNFLNIPPGNRLENLRGRYKGFRSVRINDQWRIIFRWEGNDAFDVEIVDYHK